MLLSLEAADHDARQTPATPRRNMRCDSFARVYVLLYTSVLLTSEAAHNAIALEGVDGIKCER